jgi:hypothetical protein
MPGFFFAVIVGTASLLKKYDIIPEIKFMNNRIAYYFTPTPNKIKKNWEIVLKQEIKVQTWHFVVYLKFVKSNVILFIQ